MPSKTEKQRKLFGMALAYKRGENSGASSEVIKLSELPEKTLKDYASKVDEAFNFPDNQHIRQFDKIAAKMSKMKGEYTYDEMFDALNKINGNIDIGFNGDNEMIFNTNSGWKGGFEIEKRNGNKFTIKGKMEPYMIKESLATTMAHDQRLVNQKNSNVQMYGRMYTFLEWGKKVDKI